MTGDNVSILLDCLSDTYEHNKMMAYDILKAVPPQHLPFQVCIHWLSFLRIWINDRLCLYVCFCVKFLRKDQLQTYPNWIKLNYVVFTWTSYLVWGIAVVILQPSTVLLLASSDNYCLLILNWGVQTQCLMTFILGCPKLTGRHLLKEKKITLPSIENNKK